VAGLFAEQFKQADQISPHPAEKAAVAVDVPQLPLYPVLIVGEKFQ
jgi:hypothetical protein